MDVTGGNVTSHVVYVASTSRPVCTKSARTNDGATAHCGFGASAPETSFTRAGPICTNEPVRSNNGSPSATKRTTIDDDTPLAGSVTVIVASTGACGTAMRADAAPSALTAATSSTTPAPSAATVSSAPS